MTDEERIADLKLAIEERDKLLIKLNDDLCAAFTKQRITADESAETIGILRERIAELEAQLAILSRWTIKSTEEIAELEQRPTHENFVAWLKALADSICNESTSPENALAVEEAAQRYRAEFSPSWR